MALMHGAVHIIAVEHDSCSGLVLTVEKAPPVCGFPLQGRRPRGSLEVPQAGLQTTSSALGSIIIHPLMHDVARRANR